MINKLKISLLVAVLSLAVGGASLANAAALNYTSDTNITLAGFTYTIQAGSAATSLVVNASTIAVLVPTGSTFTLVSPDKRTLGFNGSNSAATCSASVNTLVVTGDSSTTVTITPTSVICGNTGGLGVGSTSTTTTTTTTVSSGGGGGGSTYVPPATSTSTLTVTPTTVVTTTAIPGCTGTTGFSTVTGQSCAGNTAMATTSITGCLGTSGFSTVTGQSCAGNTMSATVSGGKYNFGAVTLKNGSAGDAVKQLQMFLNDTMKLGLKLDGKLGPKTIAVIKAWQKSKGLVADGLIGPKTKAMMYAEATGQ